MHGLSLDEMRKSTEVPRGQKSRTRRSHEQGSGSKMRECRPGPYMTHAPSEMARYYPSCKA